MSMSAHIHIFFKHLLLIYYIYYFTLYTTALLQYTYVYTIKYVFIFLNDVINKI